MDTEALGNMDAFKTLEIHCSSADVNFMTAPNMDNPMSCVAHPKKIDHNDPLLNAKSKNLMGNVAGSGNFKVTEAQGSLLQ